MALKTLNILIVEDDFSFSLELELLVKEIGYNVMAVIDNSAQALEQIFTQQPDLILMDIDIKGKLSGLDLAEKIQHLNIPILFITSFNQRNLYDRAKKTNFIGYMVKPVAEYSLRSSIELAITNLNLQKNSSPQKTSAFPFKQDLFFKKKGVFKRINIAQINFIEANGNLSITKTDEESFVTSLSLSELTVLLKEYHFFRIHRSYLINLQKITSLDIVGNKVMIGSRALPISRSKKEELSQVVRLLQ